MVRRSTRTRTATQKAAPAPAPAPAARKSKRKAPAAKKKKATATKKTKLTNLKARKTQTADFSLEDVVVDPQATLDDVKVCKTPDEEEVPTDAMLALVNPAKNSDKFYILQLVENEDSTKFHLYMRWGRTGTSGQAQVEDYDDFDKGFAAFDKKFKAKTGLPWDERQEAAAQDENHYHFVGHNMFDLDEHYVSSAGEDNASVDNPKWQYWVDDGVDGKEDGWYNYDATGGSQVERLWREYQNLLASTQQQHDATYVAVRIVASGTWNYAVDLVNMTQTNVTHTNHTRRFIRRFTGGDDNGPPAATTTIAAKTVPVTPSTSTTTTTSLKTTPAAATASSTAAVVTPAKRNLFNTPQTKKSSTGPPVDDLISITGNSASNFKVVESGENPGTWYDVVLNQCNISGNNNKYYRLQMLQETSGSQQVYVWFRWGRVGEMPRPSTSTFLGPYEEEEGPAFKAFTKKYRDKTGNVFGADEFKPKKGKYTPIEVDHNVEVTDEALDAASAANQKNAVKKEEIEYLPSKLDKTTQDLIETLFSKEMRNEALSSFQIDLKRLPLGVPSQAQIQSGIDVLTQIEEKLNDPTSQSESFVDLSSRFYTTIPHSFGRKRPPVIGDKESLQSRYDMCNILLDMYSTSETMRQIEAQEQKAVVEKKVLPSPVDQHYDSLHADLSLLDKVGKEFQVVQQYFETTKGSHAKNAKVLNVWSVNRHQEDERFEAHSKVGNRYLLWHGTNIAVVAPILTSGLRIMPHSGGRVGAGIYLANLQEKSAQYTSGYGAKYACMFLCEAPLGKQHVVHQDGSHASGLKAAPKGFDSVHAVGRTQPKKFTNLKLDGKTVKVPCQAPKDGNKKSSFWHDELLVYQESQVRLRYVITVKLY